MPKGAPASGNFKSYLAEKLPQAFIVELFHFPFLFFG